MPKKYYFDTAIWLDFFESRDDPNIPKGEWARRLLRKIIENDERIVVSDHNLTEMNAIGYPVWEIDRLFKPLRPILVFVEASRKEIGKAKDLAQKRNVPKGDALHALIARDNKATLVTLDKHFQELKDLAEPKRPQDLI